MNMRKQEQNISLILTISLHLLLALPLLDLTTNHDQPISFGVQFSIASGTKIIENDVQKSKLPQDILTNESKESNAEIKNETPQKTSQNGSNGDDTAMVEYNIGSTQNPAPHYPSIAKRNGWQGTSLICASVDKTGIVKSAFTCGSSGYAALDSSALETIKTWKFSIKSNQKEIYNVKVKINFILQ